MKLETLEKGKKLVERANDLKDQDRRFKELIKYKGHYLRDDCNNGSVNLKTIDPSGELTNTIFTLIEAKLQKEMKKVDQEFEAL